MTFNKLRAALLDLDGVIMDSEPLHAESLLAACRHFGIAFRPDELPGFRGRTETAVAQAMLDRKPGAGLRLADFSEFKKQSYVRLAAERLAPIRQVETFLERCRQHAIRTVVVTSGHRANAVGPLRRFHLEAAFEFIIAGEDVTHGKPHPEPYLLAIQRLECAAHQCLVLEDSRFGVMSGKAAGAWTVGLTGTFPRADLEQAGADAVVDSYPELIALLDNPA